jgi:glycerol-3-phosphate acyltransferase PlsY
VVTFWTLLAAYLLGALPFGYIVTWLVKRTDIRRYGSGNIGATNVMRLLGPAGGLLVLFLDALKGAVAVLLARAAGGGRELLLAAALLAMIGHSYPVFLKFRGGKGAATGIGVLIPLTGWVTAAVLGVAAAVIAATRYVSLGSIAGALSLPLFLYLFGFEPVDLYFGGAAALLVLLRHRENIRRLLQGKEPKLGQRVKAEEKKD